MNAVDLVIVGLLVAAAAHGLTQGAAIQVLSLGGFWLGLWLGAVAGPPLAHLADGVFMKAFLSLLALFGLATAGGAGGRVVGVHAWAAIRRAKLGPLDAAAGAAVTATATLAAVWLLALLLAAGPSTQLSATVQSSAIVRALEEHLPPAPSVFARLRNLLNPSIFPQVFAGFEPTPAPPVDLPANPDVQAAVAAAGAATVKVVGIGCGGVQTGSGFVAAPNLVVTNAHVVAGIQRPTVEDRRGRHAATPVLFDPSLDVAVLRVGGLAAGPLPLLRAEVRRGDGTAVLGYPHGGGFRSSPAAVLSRFEAVGRDIYGRSLTRREVYQLQAHVEPGNSGGPFVRRTGEVIGVVFASSTTDPNVGYALASPDVARRVDQAARQPAAVSTGPCAT